MGRVIVMNPDADADKDRNMVQHLLGLSFTLYADHMLHCHSSYTIPAIRCSPPHSVEAPSGER